RSASSPSRTARFRASTSRGSSVKRKRPVSTRGPRSPGTGRPCSESPASGHHMTMSSESGEWARRSVTGSGIGASLAGRAVARMSPRARASAGADGAGPRAHAWPRPTNEVLAAVVARAPPRMKPRRLHSCHRGELRVEVLRLRVVHDEGARALLRVDLPVFRRLTPDADRVNEPYDS